MSLRRGLIALLLFALGLAAGRWARHHGAQPRPGTASQELRKNKVNIYFEGLIV